MSTVQQTKNEMIAAKTNEAALSELTSTTKVSIWQHLFYVVSKCIEDLKKYFDSHRDYVDERLANQIAGTLPWYRMKALEFQYGFDLIENTDKFENGLATQEEIEASKIIKYATSGEGSRRNNIVIKVATEKDGKFSTIEPEQAAALKAYFEEIRWPGKEITIINSKADKLFLKIRIYRDPLVLSEEGVSIFKGTKPVEEALLELMKELPFNGELVLQSLVDKLQVVEGVKTVHLEEIKSSYLDPSKNEYGTPELIQVKKIPESGYFDIETFDNISYVV